MLVSIAVAATGQATSPRRYNFESQVSGPSCSCHLPGSHKTELELKEGRRGGGERLGRGQSTLERKAQVLPWATSSCRPLPSPCLRWSHGPSSIPFSKLMPCFFGLVTGGDMAVLSEGQLRHFPETRNPDPGHGPRNRGTGAEAGGHRGLSSPHPRPATR